ncbi:hypothetical protein D3Z52_24180 [Clostridiaceae bacterium]|jgi:hypothetical protein|nr:hypothetical protein [Clostridiaceae bacterium]
MKKTLSNARMAEMLHQLRPLLSRRDKLGYAAARNYRILSDSLTEYEVFRRELIEKYGESGADENGAPTFSIQIGSPNFKLFCDELAPISKTEHGVELMTAKYSDAVGNLSGEEILGVDWMLED